MADGSAIGEPETLSDLCGADEFCCVHFAAHPFEATKPGFPSGGLTTNVVTRTVRHQCVTTFVVTGEEEKLLTESPVQTRPETCRCDWSDYGDHDLLLSIETDFAAMASLVTSVDSWVHLDMRDTKQVSPLDLMDFAAQHNWVNPVDVFQTMQALTSMHQENRRSIDGVWVTTATEDSFAARITDLEDSVSAMRDEVRTKRGGTTSAIANLLDKIEGLEERLTNEVRTKRVVVVDDDGNERIVAEANENYARLQVHGLPYEFCDGVPSTNSVALIADSDDGERVGVYLWMQGDTSAAFEAHNPLDEHGTLTKSAFPQVCLFNDDRQNARLIRVYSDRLENVPFENYKSDDA